MAAAIDSNSLLLFRVGPVLCCAPSLPVESIIQPPTLTRPPGTDAAKPGIFRHSGHIVSSIELRYKFGLEEEHWTKPGRTIVTEIDPGRIGFWVDEILDVIDFPASGWSPLPPHLPRGVFSRTLILDNKIYLYAEFNQLYKIPTSGYLRVYIEQLFEEQRRREHKSQEHKSQQTKQDIKKKESSQTNNTKTTASSGLPNATGSSIKNTRPNNNHQLESNPTPNTISENSPSNNSLPNTVSSQENASSIETNNSNIKSSTLAPTTSLSNTTKDHALTSETKNKNAQSNEKKHVHNQQTKAGIANKIENIKSIPTAPTPTLGNSGTKSSNDSKPLSATNMPEISRKPKDALASHAPTESNAPVKNTVLSDKNIHNTRHTTQILNSHSTPNQNANSMAQESDTQSPSVMPVLFFLVLLVSSFSGLFWYFTQDKDTPILVTRVDNEKNEPSPITGSEPLPKPTENKPQTDSTQQEERSATSIDETAETKPVEPDTIAAIPTETPLSEIAKNSDSSQSTPTESDIQETEIADNVAATRVPDVNQSSSEDKPTFKADIQKDEDGITIILEVPSGENVFKQVKDIKQTDSVQPEKTTDEVTTSELTKGVLTTQTETKAQPEISETPPTPRIIDTEIIHIVVKGDTLWHIAIKYVNDPYKYPELAKLSNIKNPDLIYPGNRVRIIKRSK